MQNESPTELRNYHPHPEEDAPEAFVECVKCHKENVCEGKYKNEWICPDCLETIFDPWFTLTEMKIFDEFDCGNWQAVYLPVTDELTHFNFTAYESVEGFEALQFTMTVEQLKNMGI